MDDLGQLSTLLREMADPLILNNYATAHDVVAFNTGSQPDRQVRRAVFSVTATAQPAATAMVATGQSDRLSRAWYRMTRYSLWVLMGLTLPLMVFRDEFFQLYLGMEKYLEYQDASLVMLLLLARYVSISPNAIVGLMAIARADMHPAAWRAMAVETTNVLLTVLLVVNFEMGAIGAACSTLVVHGILHPALNWTLGLRLAGVGFGGWARRSIVPGLLPGLVAAPAWLVLNHFIAPDAWLELGLAALGGYLVYFVSLWAILPREDRADAVTALGRITRR